VRTINKIIIHCSATPEGRWHDVNEIKRWHLKRGFLDIGYHYVIYLDGTVAEGRPVNQAGAHVTGQNAHSIGICYVGGMDKQNKVPKDTRTEYQKESLKELVKELLQKYPGSTVHGHNEFAAKACPSFNVQKECWK